MKVHCRLTKDKPNIPCCAFNNRNYKELPNEFVKSPQEFRKVPTEERCQHCCDRYLIVRNKQRKAKGLDPVSTAFEGLDE